MKVYWKRLGLEIGSVRWIGRRLGKADKIVRFDLIGENVGKLEA